MSQTLMFSAMAVATFGVLALAIGAFQGLLIGRKLRALTVLIACVYAFAQCWSVRDFVPEGIPKWMLAVGSVFGAVLGVLLCWRLHRKLFEPWYETRYFVEQNLVARLIPLLEQIHSGKDVNWRQVRAQLVDCAGRARGLADSSPRGLGFDRLAAALSLEISHIDETGASPKSGFAVRAVIVEVQSVSPDGSKVVLEPRPGERIGGNVFNARLCPPKACVDGGSFFRLSIPEGPLCFLAPSEAADRQFFAELRSEVAAGDSERESRATRMASGLERGQGAVL